MNFGSLVRADTRHISIILGLCAAFLFAAGAQFSKLLLAYVDPLVMAGFVYLGSGFGLLLLISVSGALGRPRKGYEAVPSRKDIPWLLATMLFGAFLGPVVLMYSLPETPPATAAMLLNFEAVATTLFAIVWAGEPIGRRIWAAISLITLSCILLTYTPEAVYGISLGALGVLFACTFWGLDNNIVQRISGKDPIIIVMIKGLCVGSFTVLLAGLLGKGLPEPFFLLGSMVIGSMGFGGIMSVCLVLAIRGLGSTRAAAFFSLSPFFGLIFAFLIFTDMPGLLFIPAFVLMICGSFLLMTEQHTHSHSHAALYHEHRHRHNDLHHEHGHTGGEPFPDSWGYHAHLHHHEAGTHTHPHSPDIDHRHQHEKIR